jgi:hypothetical protein
MDGHTGLSNEELKRHQTNTFELVLSYLLETRSDSFVMHVAYSQKSSVLPPFLRWCGFNMFNGGCRFHEHCWWRTIAIVQSGMQHGLDRKKSMIHGFDKFASRIDELFSLRQQFDGIIKSIQESCDPLPIFNAPVDITAMPGDIPAWADEVKPPKLKSLENDKNILEREIADLSKYLLLVTAQSAPLENAVKSALHTLGLSAEKTEKGANTDIFAWNADHSIEFGIEATGIKGLVKKDSDKLTQITGFEQHKKPHQKGILIANTYRDMPVANRPEESFTRDAIAFLEHYPILLMTGYDLYLLVHDVIDGRKTKENVVNALNTTVGVFDYLATQC